MLSLVPPPPSKAIYSLKVIVWNNDDLHNSVVKKIKETYLTHSLFIVITCTTTVKMLGKFLTIEIFPPTI